LLVQGVDHPGLYERGIAPDLLIGTSAGALNAAFLASRPATVATAQELAALWRGLRRRDILPLRPATLLGGLAGRRDHLIRDQALRRLPWMRSAHASSGR
jgi:NTE family protein